MKTNKIAAGIIVGIILLAGSPFMLRLIWPPINDVSTGATPQYADIQPQRFNQPADKVFNAALETSRQMGWEIRESAPATGTIEAVDTTRLFKFQRRRNGHHHARSGTDHRQRSFALARRQRRFGYERASHPRFSTGTGAPLLSDVILPTCSPTRPQGQPR
jgi:hypothetical protein